MLQHPALEEVVFGEAEGAGDLVLIAWEKGVKVEPGKDVELTNWDTLSATVDAVRARFAGEKARA